MLLTVQNKNNVIFRGFLTTAIDVCHSSNTDKVMLSLLNNESYTLLK